MMIYKKIFFIAFILLLLNGCVVDPADDKNDVDLDGGPHGTCYEPPKTGTRQEYIKIYTNPNDPENNLKKEGVWIDTGIAKENLGDVKSVKVEYVSGNVELCSSEDQKFTVPYALCSDFKEPDYKKLIPINEGFAATKEDLCPATGNFSRIMKYKKTSISVEPNDLVSFSPVFNEININDCTKLPNTMGQGTFNMASNGQTKSYTTKQLCDGIDIRGNTNESVGLLQGGNNQLLHSILSNDPSPKGNKVTFDAIEKQDVKSSFDIAGTMIKFFNDFNARHHVNGASIDNMGIVTTTTSNAKPVKIEDIFQNIDAYCKDIDADELSKVLKTFNPSRNRNPNFFSDAEKFVTTQGGPQQASSIITPMANLANFFSTIQQRPNLPWSICETLKKMKGLFDGLFNSPTYKTNVPLMSVFGSTGDLYYSSGDLRKFFVILFQLSKANEIKQKTVNVGTSQTSSAFQCDLITADNFSFIQNIQPNDLCKEPTVGFYSIQGALLAAHTKEEVGNLLNSFAQKYGNVYGNIAADAKNITQYLGMPIQIKNTPLCIDFSTKASNFIKTMIQKKTDFINSTNKEIVEDIIFSFSSNKNVAPDIVTFFIEEGDNIMSTLDNLKNSSPGLFINDTYLLYQKIKNAHRSKNICAFFSIYKEIIKVPSVTTCLKSTPTVLSRPVINQGLGRMLEIVKPPAQCSGGQINGNRDVLLIIYNHMMDNSKNLINEMTNYMSSSNASQQEKASIEWTKRLISQSAGAALCNFVSNAISIPIFKYEYTRENCRNYMLYFDNWIRGKEISPISKDATKLKNYDCSKLDPYGEYSEWDLYSLNAKCGGIDRFSAIEISTFKNSNGDPLAQPFEIKNRGGAGKLIVKIGSNDDQYGATGEECLPSGEMSAQCANAELQQRNTALMFYHPFKIRKAGEIMLMALDTEYGFADNMGGYHINIKRRCPYTNGERLYAYVGTSPTNIKPGDASTIKIQVNVPNQSNTQVIDMSKYQENDHLYLAIKPRESDYTKGSGYYYIKLYFQESAVMPSIAIGKIFKIIRKILSFDIADSYVQESFRKFASNLSNAIKALISLYLVYIGLGYITGIVPMSKENTIMSIIKIGFIMQLTRRDSWEFFNNLFFKQITPVINSLISMVSLNDKPVNDFTFFDETFGALFNAGVGRKVLAILLSGPIGLIVFIVLVMAYWKFTKLCLKGLLMYAIAMMAIAFLLTVFPLFLTFILFKQTRYLFDAWLKMLIGYIAQPAFYFVSIGFMIQILQYAINDIFYFQLCNICVFGILLGVPGQGLFSFLPSMLICLADGWLPKAYIDYSKGGGGGWNHMVNYITNDLGEFLSGGIFGMPFSVNTLFMFLFLLHAMSIISKVSQTMASSLAGFSYAHQGISSATDAMIGAGKKAFGMDEKSKQRRETAKQMLQKFKSNISAEKAKRKDIGATDPDRKKPESKLGITKIPSDKTKKGEK